MYLTNDHVEAEVVDVGGARGVVWIPESGSPYLPYLDFFPLDMAVRLIFTPGTSRAKAMAHANALK
jgi:hypothetical protein